MHRVAEWPRLETGRLDTDGDAFRLMYHVPGIKELHMLKDSLNVIVKANLPIGRDGRNRPSLFPFGTSTGRNAHGKSLFNAHAAMRGFMVFPDDVVAVYLDWSQQEVALGAALSGDEDLMQAYLSGDVYHAFARDIGLTDDPDPKHWKKHDPNKIRDRMKSLYLAITYGMGVPSLAQSLQRHPLIASALIEKHKRRYPKFWQWRTERALSAMLNRVTMTEFGWPLRISTSPNQRTLVNFGCQGNGAECLRIAATRLCDAGLVPSMLVHDAVLMELPNHEQVGQSKDIMLRSGRDVCGLEIRVDGDVAPIRRYRDKRGTEMWDRIMTTLQAVGAIPAGMVP